MNKRIEFERGVDGLYAWEREGISRASWLRRRSQSRTGMSRAEYAAAFSRMQREVVGKLRTATGPVVVVETTEERRRGFEAYDRLRALGREVNLQSFMAESGLSRIVYEHVKAAREAEERLGEIELSETAESKLQRKLVKISAVMKAQAMEDARLLYVELYQKMRQEFIGEIEQARAITQSYKGIFSKAEFNTLRRCLHADTARHVSEETLNEAFRLLTEKEALLWKKEQPTERKLSGTMPATWEEMVARKRSGRR